MRGAITYLLSGLVHIAALSWFSGVGDRDPAPLATTQGRASIQLISSVTATPTPTPDEELEAVRDPLHPEPERREAKAQAEREPAEPQKSKQPRDLIAGDASTAAIEPTAKPQPAPPSKEPLEDAPADPPRRKPTVKSDADPANVVDATSTASVGSEAFNGTEYDDLPRMAAANAPPPYPQEAYREGRQGVVRLRVSITASGTVSAIAIDASSGVPALDESAVSTVRGWRFQPALRRGVAVSMDAIVPIRFSIRAAAKAAKK